MAVFARTTWTAWAAMLTLGVGAAQGQQPRVNQYRPVVTSAPVGDFIDEPPPPIVDKKVEPRTLKGAAPFESPPVKNDEATNPPSGPEPTVERQPMPGELFGDEMHFGEEENLSWLISTREWINGGRMYALTEGTMLSRSAAPRQPLSDLPTVLQGIGVFFPTVMSTQSGGFSFEPGARITIGRNFERDERNRDHSWEFTFLGLNEWQSEFAVVANAGGQNLVLPQNRSQVVFNDATRHEYQYSSDLNSFELNRRVRFGLGRDRLVLSPEGTWDRQITPGYAPSIFGGFRVVTIDEDFRFAALGANPATQTGTYDIHTDNNLVGIQIGGEILDQHGNWHWGVRTKLGGLVNFASQHSIVNIDNAGTITTRDEEASENQLTFAADVGIVGAYYIRPNIILKAAYDFSYLQGLALAPQQLQFNPGPEPQVTTGNHIFYTGGSFGVEVQW